MKSKSTEEWVEEFYNEFSHLEFVKTELSGRNYKTIGGFIEKALPQHTNNKLQEVLEKIEKKHWLISDRDEGLALQEKHGHNGCLDEIIAILQAEITQ